MKKEMKSKEEILSTKDSYYSTNVYKTGEKAYRESDVLKAMQSYADQFKPKWISVDERLPERNKNVLVMRRKYELTAFQRDGIFYSNETALKLEGIKFWQPLPPQPEAE